MATNPLETIDAKEAKMKTCLSIAVLSTALIGGSVTTSTPAHAYAGWSCKPRVHQLAQGPVSYAVLRARARAKWVAYVQGHYGAAYLNPRGLYSGCTWFCWGGCTAMCKYDADPCKLSPSASQTKTKAGAPSAGPHAPLPFRPGPKAPPRR
jgi:hypothetical protein